jgi:hypothetical protein
MKKLVLLAVIALSSLRAMADEGMWLPLLLGQATYNDMVKKGCKLTKEQIFSLNKKSIKDAIVHFGGFCTGEIVSSQGLVFTNHHCGYDAIAEKSSKEQNYLKDGFFAATKEQEIPIEGLFVNFLDNIKDVTKEVNEALGNSMGAERSAKLSKIYGELAKANTDAATFTISRVSSFFKGNQFLMFTYKQYRDIRFVGCPPESFGKYGGDTDNWMWPRHTNDFSVFRVYAGAQGEAAEYSASNKPLVPKHFLPVSVAPRKQGEFNMILGYPGSTNRFEVSYGARMSRDVADPAYVKMRDIRLKSMKAEMDKSVENRLQLASEYANLANYWKFFDLESKQLRSRKVVEKKEMIEADFQKWAKGKPQYETVLNGYKENYDKWLGFEKMRNYLNQGVFGPSTINLSIALFNVHKQLKDGKVDDAKKVIENLNKNRAELLKSVNLTADKNMVAKIGHAYYMDIDKSQHCDDAFKLVSAFGDLNNAETFSAFAKAAYEKSVYANEAKWNAFVTNPTAAALEEDLLVLYSGAFNTMWNTKYVPMYTSFINANNDLGRAWVKGLMEKNTTTNYYPDANSTMRFTYGTVQPYKPRDGVNYDFVTTATGLLEKYVPGDEEFDIPANALALLEKKDFGQYKDAGKNDLVTCFLNTCDITGGNSGSAVLNANGDLIGLAFDGNSESMDQKLNFYGPATRCICVDIRYVLWCIDKVGKAPHIIKELMLKK